FVQNLDEVLDGTSVASFDNNLASTGTAPNLFANPRTFGMQNIPRVEAQRASGLLRLWQEPGWIQYMPRIKGAYELNTRR
ncbi:hypothetical protein, partial [Pseudomonas syringae]|uniref:hypothetical protein n=1 Tax=Pseudomonas syringae TaxID=317 RepID=UPI000AE76C22